ncbi:hypothetical protein BSQ98_18250 [Serratia liquefaciens]|uniref:beta family protein n=1 Tax=Serratia liquefaciens TaxID=614 RepID=UPI0010216059|nr:hypothetical protein [Serratia liquefaciens]RYM61529.1 hypothetical protein BSQ98_18250 [Serratia liquefaciens]
MSYLVAVKNGQNDIKGIIELDPVSKNHVIPMILTAGSVFKIRKEKVTDELKKDLLIEEFVNKWDGGHFLVDVSRANESDISCDYNTYHGLHDSANGYERRVDFYRRIYEINNRLIPVISWDDKDSYRNVLRFSIKIESFFNKLAINVDARKNKQIETLKLILSAIEKPEETIVILNYFAVSESNSPDQEKVIDIVNDIKTQYNVKMVVLLSSSFPIIKPAEKDSWKASQCLDLIWQVPISKHFKDDIEILYGDYGATTPAASTEFIPGMSIIPCVTYHRNGYWFQRKSGGDKEFAVFKELAKKIVSSDFYHDDDFCWANRKISAISREDEEGYGNQGVWNGYKINQHISEILNILSRKSTLQDYDEDE